MVVKLLASKSGVRSQGFGCVYFWACLRMTLHQENMSVKCVPPQTSLLYSKTGVCRGIPIFLIFAPKHRLLVLAQKPAQNIQLEKQFRSTPSTYNGQIFRPGCQVQIWILHTEIQDGVQNGRQKDTFSIFPITQLRFRKACSFCVVLLKSK